jgi:hypothetical protein
MEQNPSGSAIITKWSRVLLGSAITTKWSRVLLGSAIIT